MGVFSNGGRRLQQWRSTQPQRKRHNSTSKSCDSINRRSGWCDRCNDKFLRFIRYGQHGELYNNRSGRSVSIYSDLFWARNDKSNNNSKSNRNRKRNRNNKYFYAIAAILSIANPSVALAESVGGVSATANPIANSSGSVTNQAIQVLQGPYITNTYGNQISCQGPTFNATPYIQYSNSYKQPWEDYYLEPQYDNRDYTGRTTEQTVTVNNYPWEPYYDDRVRTDPNDPKYDVNEDGIADRWWEDGAPMQIEMDVDGPDGLPDNPGSKVWDKPVRTNMSSNHNLNIGLSATISYPMDGKLQELCKQAAITQIEQQQQLTANKRLDFEIARLKNCGELMKAGIMFHPRSPYASICADVVLVQPPNTLKPHTHSIQQPTFSPPSSTPLSPGSDPVAPTSVPVKKGQDLSSQEQTSLLQLPSSQSVLSPSKANQQGALLGGPMSLRQPRY